MKFRIENLRDIRVIVTTIYSNPCLTVFLVGAVFTGLYLCGAF